MDQQKAVDGGGARANGGRETSEAGGSKGRQGAARVPPACVLCVEREGLEGEKKRGGGGCKMARGGLGGTRVWGELAGSWAGLGRAGLVWPLHFIDLHK